MLGRKSDLSEHPLTFIEMLRRIVEHERTAEEAVKVYHDQLKKLGIERCAIWPLTCSLPRR